ncbi:hypothetical protein EV643_114233 [Kribbella sp. VKM Ac-2527]|uniref:Uncharacterized protein n=1 Tax=Kribbella caucasensis TaxID=2512215 RepID=A0A4R6K8K7_9ACTN|nr:hypothetical protein [Kribbella sp. VKM Ac-2527]TDO45088.1 hypothetical protein EV643_114233 [Kribbella sp. VKM Ac-2527]
MSTPSEGPARSWTPGDVQAAAKVFADLNTSEQQALMRSIRTHEILAPVHNAIERSVAFTRASIEGLSDYAQQLAVGARMLGQSATDRATQFGQNVAARAGQVRDATTQFGQNTAQRAGAVRENASNRGTQLSARVAELVKNARDGVTGGVNWAKNTAADVATRAAEGVNAGRQAAVNLGNQAMDAGRQAVDAGRQAVQTGRDAAVNFGQQAVETGRQAVETGRQTAVNVGNQAVAAGRQAVEAGREAAGRAGRWFNNQISNAAAKASATFAGIAERRMDPALKGPDLSLPDNLRINQHLTEIASAQTPDQLNNAAGNLATFINERRQQMTGTQMSAQEASNLARVAFSGVGERAGETRPAQAAGQGQDNQGAQARPNLTKPEPKGPKIGG